MGRGNRNCSWDTWGRSTWFLWVGIIGDYWKKLFVGRIKSGSVDRINWRYEYLFERLARFLGVGFWKRDKYEPHVLSLLAFYRLR